MKTMKKAICFSLSLALMLALLCGCSVKPEDCDHPSHDAGTLICDKCHTEIDHHFIDGKCTMCDTTTEFQWESIVTNEEIATYTAQQGTVEKLVYQTRAYNQEALHNEGKIYEGDETENTELITKEAYVYLPYGYNEREKYNVLILLHGTGETEGYWFGLDDRLTNYSTSNTYTRGTKISNPYGVITLNVLDYMMANGLAEQTIVVTPTFYDIIDIEGINLLQYEENDVVKRVYGNEIVNYLLPAVIETYSTYAQSGCSEDIIAARDHFAYAGLSRGSRMGLDSVMMDFLPYFAYYGSYSSPSDMPETLSEKLNSSEYDSFDVKYWYAGVGTNDTGRNDELYECYQILLEQTPIISSENSAYTLVYNTAHTYDCWITCLYNSMLKFFK